MATRLFAKRIQIYEGEPVIFVARIETAGGTPLVISQVSSFSVHVLDMTSATPDVPVYSVGAIPSSTGYFDTLQHDDAENLLGDADGYNFRYVIAYDEYAFAGGHAYRVEILSAIGGSYHAQIYDVVVGEVMSL